MSFVTNFYVEELPVWPVARAAIPAAIQSASGFNHSPVGTVTQPTGVSISPVAFPDAPDTAPPAGANRTDAATAAGNAAVARLTTHQTLTAAQLTAVAALLPAPTSTLTTVAPATGPVTGGTALTLTGTGFVSPATVTIGGRPCTSVVVVSATSITCVAPAGAMKGIEGVSVAGAGGNAYKASAYTYT